MYIGIYINVLQNIICQSCKQKSSGVELDIITVHTSEFLAEIQLDTK